MKTKLSLTVRKGIVSRARRYAKRTGKSISQIFEEFFQNIESGGNLKNDRQKAAKRLLQTLASSTAVKTLDDKELLKEHAARKFA